MHRLKDDSESDLANALASREFIECQSDDPSVHSTAARNVTALRPRPDVNDMQDQTTAYIKQCRKTETIA
jgi:hypothetical protein